jgi:hypothetical protein
VDCRPDEDVEPADVVQRQRAQPTIAGLGADRICRGRRARGVVAMGQPNQLRLAGRARGGDHRVHGVRWMIQSERGRALAVQRQSCARLLRRQRLERRAAARQRVQQRRERERGRGGRLHPLAGRHVEPARQLAGSGVQLRVRQAAVVGLDRQPVGVLLCRCREPIPHPPSD